MKEEYQKITHNKMRDIAGYVIENTGQDIFKESSRSRITSPRSLFVYCCRELDIDYRQIVKFFEDNGLLRSEATVHNMSYSYPRKEAKDPRLKFLKSRILRGGYMIEGIEYEQKQVEQTSTKCNCNEGLTPLQELVSQVPKDKEAEMIEHITLRIKSWEWKSKDYCQVIECHERIDGTF